MKILVDESVNFRIIKRLKEENFEVSAIAEHSSGISDTEVILLAQTEGRILLTEDKDFGTLVFAHNNKNISVILLRYNKNEEEKIIENTLSILNPSNFESFVFVTITAQKIRITSILNRLNLNNIRLSCCYESYFSKFLAFPDSLNKNEL